MKAKKNKEMLATFIVGGLVAVVGAHMLEPHVKKGLKV